MRPLNQLIITDCPLPALPQALKGTAAVIAPNGALPAARPCTGCFCCWTKTPGRCIVKDGYQKTGEQLAGVQQLTLISRCVYGSLSPFVKGVLDRAISYVLPYFTVYRGEMHHKTRYQNRIVLSVYAYGPGVTGAEQETLKAIIAANAVNLHGRVGSVVFANNAGEIFSLLN